MNWSRHYPYHVILEILGCVIVVRGSHATFIRDVADYFSCHVINVPWRTPDLCIDCDWPRADRRLFRARPDFKNELLAGVKVTLSDANEPLDWRLPNQAIPPLDLPPFKDRFFALHAAAVAWPSLGKCVVIAGNKNAGKSTTAMLLVNEFGGRLLSDENAVFHIRTTMVEPFLRPVHTRLAEHSTHKMATRAEEATNGRVGTPSIATHIVFLQPGSGSIGSFTLSIEAAFDLALSHSVDFGADLDAAVISLVGLVRSTTAMAVRYAGYSELRDVSQIILNICGVANPGNEARRIRAEKLPT